MKVETRFDGSASYLTIIPESARDKDQLRLLNLGRPQLTIKPTQEDCLVIEARATEVS